MINDDWAFTRTFQAWGEGRFVSTGWGPDASRGGGPSLVAQLAWAGAVTWVLGDSLTALRVSVLTLGVIGSAGLMMLLRSLGTAPWISFLGALALAANPLFLSQSFTFMTDVPFVTFLILALLCLQVGLKNARWSLVTLGLFLSLLATLTRQLGIVVPLGLVIGSLFHPGGRSLGRGRTVFLALGIGVLPWLGYEFLLSHLGSSPVSQHSVVHDIFRQAVEKGFSDYLLFVATQFCWAFGYVAFLVSPVVMLCFRSFMGSRAFRVALVLSAGGFLLSEAALLAGFLNPPVLLYRNVLVDFGIGPILLKDTYILGIQRLSAMPQWLYVACAWWTLVAGVGLGVMTVSFLRGLSPKGSPGDRERNEFFPLVLLVTGSAYLGIILISGFHDRYLIPLCAIVIVWILSRHAHRPRTGPSAGGAALALASLVPVAIFGVLATRDFMEFKRHQKMAHDFLVNELRMDPCRVDGGFEFNGYHCYDPGFRPAEGLSWWWVREERYLMALGEIPGYRVVERYPFTRWLGRNGAVHVLEPLSEPKDPSPSGKSS
jgi:hypothetical protein